MLQTPKIMMTARDITNHPQCHAYHKLAQIALIGDLQVPRETGRGHLDCE